MTTSRAERRHQLRRIKDRWRAVVRQVWRVAERWDPEAIALRHAAGKHCSCYRCTGYYKQRDRKDVKDERRKRDFDEEAGE